MNVLGDESLNFVMEWWMSEEMNVCYDERLRWCISRWWMSDNQNIPIKVSETAMCIFHRVLLEQGHHICTWRQISAKPYLLICLSFRIDLIHIHIILETYSGLYGNSFIGTAWIVTPESLLSCLHWLISLWGYTSKVYRVCISDWSWSNLLDDMAHTLDLWVNGS